MCLEEEIGEATWSGVGGFGSDSGKEARGSGGSVRECKGRRLGCVWKREWRGGDGEDVDVVMMRFGVRTH